MDRKEFIKLASTGAIGMSSLGTFHVKIKKIVL
ncbi:MAG: hypothetical protein CM15mP102_19510 [Flavobacteriales bacterium]|nr:MAG: hypothetical protein CM15mP102_19510 [Flavobacteriales bacterium]